MWWSISKEEDFKPSSRKREKFTELAEKRVNKTIKAIRLVGNLSDKTNYKYEPEDAQKIVEALEAELHNLKSRFKNGEVEENDFTLS